MAKRIHWIMWFIGVGLGYPSQTRGQAQNLVCSVMVDEHTTRVDLVQGLSLFQDTPARLTIDQVWQQPTRYPFRAVASPLPIVGPTVCFLRLTLHNNAHRTLPFLVEIDHPFLEKIEARLTTNAIVVRSWPAFGQQTRQNQRPYVHRNFILPISLPAHQTTTLWLRVQKSAGTHAFPLRLWQPDAFARHDEADTALWSGLVGWLLFATVLSLMLTALTRDTVYWLYGFYVVAHLLALIVNEGLFSDVYTAGLPGLKAEYVGDVTIGLIMGSNVLFIRSMLNIKQYVPRWLYKFSQVIIVAWVGGLLSYVLASQPLLATFQNGLYWLLYVFRFVVNPSSALIAVLFIGYGLRNDQHRRLSITYLIAYVPVIGVAFIVYFVNLINWRVGLLAQTQVYALAVVFETLILLFGLAYRFKTFRDEHEQLLREQHHTQLRERQRLARDLHDGVGVDLAILRMRLSTMADQNEADTSLTAAVSDLDRISREVREVAHALMPADLQQRGLEASLGELVDRLTIVNPHLEINFTAEIVTPVLPATEQAVYAIAKELLNNALKHAHATVIDVELYTQNNRLWLRIGDNGRGYDPRKLNLSLGIGLRNLQATARELGGQFTVMQKPTGGVVSEVVM